MFCMLVGVDRSCAAGKEAAHEPEVVVGIGVHQTGAAAEQEVAAVRELVLQDRAVRSQLFRHRRRGSG